MKASAGLHGGRGRFLSPLKVADIYISEKQNVLFESRLL